MKFNGNGRGGRPGAPAGAAKPLVARGEFDRMCALANNDDQDAQAWVRQFLIEHGDVCDRVGNMANHAQQSLVRLISEGDFLLSEALKAKAAQMRTEVAGAFPTRLELLGAERVVATWLQLQWVESMIARANGDVVSAAFWLKRQAQADRLYHAAVKSLLIMRELLPAAESPILGIVHREPSTASSETGGSGNGQQVNRIALAARNKRQRELTPV